MGKALQLNFTDVFVSFLWPLPLKRKLVHYVGHQCLRSTKLEAISDELLDDRLRLRAVVQGRERQDVAISLADLLHRRRICGAKILPKRRRWWKPRENTVNPSMSAASTVVTIMDVLRCCDTNGHHDEAFLLPLSELK